MHGRARRTAGTIPLSDIPTYEDLEDLESVAAKAQSVNPNIANFQLNRGAATSAALNELWADVAEGFIAASRSNPLKLLSSFPNGLSVLSVVPRRQFAVIP